MTPGELMGADNQLNKQQVIVISGMHRSGTSLVSSLFQKTGVNIGDNLVGSFKGNPRGHFEDVDFYNFHEKVLGRFEQNHLVQTIDVLGELTAAETAAAMSLIEARRNHEVWGWKDPRTALFLNDWHNLLPQARYVFVYRHPVEVVLSLLRRGVEVDLEVLSNPWVGLRVWQVYNQAIFNFYQQHPESCLLCHIASITADIKSFINLAAKKLALPPPEEDISTLYQAAELKQVALSPAAYSILERLAPEAMQLYAKLEAQADLPGPEPASAAMAQLTQVVELEGIVSNLTSQKALSAEQAAHFFSVLLAILDPQVVLTGKEALDEFRVNHIGHLKTHITHLEAHTTNLKAHIVHLEAHIVNLKVHTANLEAAIANLKSQASDLEQLAAYKDLLAQQQEIRIRQLEDQLSRIEKTKIWQLAQKWYALKQFFKRGRSNPQAIQTIKRENQ